MVFKQTEGLANPPIQGNYKYFHYLNDDLEGDIPNEEVTVESHPHNFFLIGIPLF